MPAQPRRGLRGGGDDAGQALRLTVYTTELERFAEINEAYAAFFQEVGPGPEAPPARVTVGVKALPKAVRVEIDAIVAIAGWGASPMPSPIERVELFGYQLTYAEGEYVMSGGRVVSVLDSTVVRLTTADGLVGHGEVCPLGANYLPAHAGGARAAIAEIAPHLIGLDAANPRLVARAMERALLGHPYAKSAVDLAAWDVLGQACGRPVCDLLGGRLQEEFPLYKAVSLASPAEMREQMQRFRAAGVHRFQLKLGNDPSEDAERARAVVEATAPGDVVLGDANCGWTLPQAIVAARQMEGLPRFFLEQPCATLEECGV